MGHPEPDGPRRPAFASVDFYGMKVAPSHILTPPFLIIVPVRSMILPEAWQNIVTRFVLRSFISILFQSRTGGCVSRDAVVFPLPGRAVGLTETAATTVPAASNVVV